MCVCLCVCVCQQHKLDFKDSFRGGLLTDSHLPHKFFKGRLRRRLNCLLFVGLLLLLDWWRNVWSAWASSILKIRLVVVVVVVDTVKDSTI